MHLVQIFLPLFDNDQQLFDRSLFDDLRNRLKEKFGGITFYRNAPVQGLWKDDSGKTNYDELIIAEVMTNSLDKDWWTQFKKELEQIFRQDEILIRSFLFEKL